MSTGSASPTTHDASRTSSCTARATSRSSLPYEGRVAALGLPALILWGEEDKFAGVKMAHRFHEELPGSELVLLADAGHFVWDDQPERATRALVDFLARHAD